MSFDLSLPIEGRQSLPPVRQFESVGIVQDADLFSSDIPGRGSGIVELQDFMEGYDPAIGRPLNLSEMPPSACEAVEIIEADMQTSFPAGFYAVRFLYRQGPAVLSLDQGYHEWHRDFHGMCDATYIVNDKQPTLVYRQRPVLAYEVVRMDGQRMHRRPSVVDDDRTTVVANIMRLSVLSQVSGGAFANIARAGGELKPVQYR